MSDGSGYVLSREALRRFVQGLNESSKCLQQDDSAADVQAGRCLFNLHILAGDSRDSRLRNRFFPLAPHFQLLSNYTRSDYPIHKHAYYYSRAVSSRFLSLSLSVEIPPSLFPTTFAVPGLSLQLSGSLSLYQSRGALRL